MELKKGYKRTDIGLIPESWKLKKIDEFASINGRVGWKGYTKKDLVEIGPYAIGAKHINKDNKLDLSEPTCLSYEKFAESPEIKVFIYDILIVQRGTIGKLVLIDREIGDATINPSMLILRSKNASQSYIYYFLNSFEGQKQIILDTSSTGVPMITQKQVLNFKIPLPPFFEQKAIAEVLSDTDQLIQNLKTLIAKKKAIKQGVMQELLTCKKRLQGFTGKWVTKKLGEIAEITGAGIDKKVNENEIPVILLNYMDVMKRDYLYKAQFNHQVTAPSKKIDGCDVQKGDIFITPSSELRTDIGISALAMEDMSGIVYSYHINRIRYKVEFNELFGLFMLKTRRFLDQAETLCEGSGKRYVISLSKFRNIDVIYPKNIKEQQAIAQILSEIDAEIEVLEQQLQKTQALKQGMMQELLTGKIRLVKSAIQEKTEALTMVAEQEVVYKKEIKYKKV